MRRMLTPALAIGFALLFGSAATPARAQFQVFNGGQVVTPFGNQPGYRVNRYSNGYVAPRPYVVQRGYGVNRHHGHHRYGHVYAGHHRGHGGRRW